MSEVKEITFEKNNTSFQVKHKDRGKKSSNIYWRDQMYENSLRALTRANIKINQEARENLKQVSVEYGKIMANKEMISITDSLTGVLNREGFKEGLRPIMKLSERYGFAITMVGLDAYNFKKFNDQNGHPEGDRFLIRMTQTVKNSIRKFDIFSRFGGDEFNLFLPLADSNKAGIVMKKVTANIGKLVENEFAGSGLRMDYGIYQWNRKENIESFIKKCDQKLYEVKGQNE